MFRIKLSKNNIDCCKTYLKKENFGAAILSFRSSLHDRLNTDQKFNYKKIAFGDDFLRFSVVRKVFYTFLYHKKIKEVLSQDEWKEAKEPKRVWEKSDVSHVWGRTLRGGLPPLKERTK